MTVESSTSGPIRLTGVCPLEDAERLLQALLISPGQAVDLTACNAAHTAVIQVLVAVMPVIEGPPAGEFLRTFIYPLVRSGDIAGP